MIDEVDIVYYIAGLSFAVLLGLSCCGMFWRYSKAVKHRRHRIQLRQTISANAVVGPVIKRDTLKNKLRDMFFTQMTSDNDPEKAMKLAEISYIDCQTSCSICLMDYEEDPGQVFIGLIKTCSHYFHFECIWEWLEQRQNCPICRGSCDLAETDILGLSLEQVLETRRGSIVIEADMGESKLGQTDLLSDCKFCNSDDDQSVSCHIVDDCAKKFKESCDGKFKDSCDEKFKGSCVQNIDRCEGTVTNSCDESSRTVVMESSKTSQL